MKTKRFVLALFLFMASVMPAYPASFYWKSTLAALQAVGAAGDRGVVIDSSGGMNFYYNNAGTWTAVTFPTLNQSTTGNAATATALAADPADCSAGQVATGIAASGALTCTASPTLTTLTADNFVSGAADNTHYFNVTNTADPTGANLAIGNAWYNKTTKLWKFRNFDNSVTSEFFTSEGTNTGSFVTTGTIEGGIKILDNTASPTAAQVLGGIIMVAGTSTVTLPTAVQNMSVCVVDNAATASNIIVDVQAGDNVVLVGVSQAGGVGITNASGSSLGDYICAFSPVNNKWFFMGSRGTWASQ